MRRCGRSGAIPVWVVGLLLAAAGAAQAQTVLFRVNAGGPLLAAPGGGPDWSEDTSGNPSPYHNGVSGLAGFAVNTTDGSVPASTPIGIFQTERWDPILAPQMTWSFPVGAPGTYEVRLYFANGWVGTQNPGDRKFDVAIEGIPVLSGYDIAADVGHLVGTRKSFFVTSDANLDIDFTHIVENPLINGIEILLVDPNGYLAASPVSLDFGLTEVGTTSPSQGVLLENLGQPGDQSITISAVTLSGDFSTDLVPQTLAPGQTVTANVSFAPGGVGAAAGALDIIHAGNNSPISLLLTGEGFNPGALPISFDSTLLQGESLSNPTSLDFGPDGRLYVSQQDGAILAYAIQRNFSNSYQVTATETILEVQNIPNHDDDGTLNLGEGGRLVTGLLAVGTPSSPVLYVTSSDPRAGAGGGGNDLNLDTNSGTISRLTWTGASWDHVVLVRGLARSEETHATNGMALDAASNVLYVMSGGQNNKGAPSNNFAATPEYALSAAMLSVDLDTIEGMPILTDAQGQDYVYDLPTLDDPDRAGDPDAGDPFGGNDGKNQARIVPGGPVQVYAPGFRNGYDVVLTTGGRLYTFDNGPNTGWGGIPIGEGPNSTCTNEINENGSQGYGDGLHFVDGPGYYGGHPHPTRANPENSDLVIYENQGGWSEVERYDWQTDFGAAPPVPFGTGDPRQCDYRIPGQEDGALAVIGSSTNGITEYATANFGGAMQGNLLAASFNGDVWRFELNGAGDTVLNQEVLFTGFGSLPLDVSAQPANEVFAGSVWVAVFGSNDIAIFEPVGFGNCTGVNDPLLDEDGDGYDNADEIANATHPCSAGSKPPDADGDLESDLLDPDDDNDGTLDAADPFAIDAANGLATVLPVDYPLFNADPATGFFGLGFTGLMANGTTDYLAQFDEALLNAGGAAGLFGVEQVSLGTAYQGQNDQDNAFQFGVAVDASTPRFSIQARLNAPYFEVNGSPTTPIDSQSFGMFFGTGDQDDYLKLVFTANGGTGGVEALLETAGATSGTVYGPATVGDILNSVFVDLYLTVDPIAASAQPAVSLNGGPIVTLGGPIAVPASWFDLGDGFGLAVGVIASAFASGQPFGATWDLMKITPLPTCADGIDNDGDGLIDFGVDPGCDSASDASERGSLVCDNGVDEDLDGWADFPDDPGCVSSYGAREDPRCQDGLNNDADGLIDFDGGESIHGPCAGGTCPAGVSDPNGDGVADPDPQCVGKPQRNDEWPSRRCGLGFELTLLLPGLMWLRRRRHQRPSHSRARVQ